MEVVGVAASFIAIGQALAALPTLVGIIQSVVKVREELSDLLFELEILAATREDIRMCIELIQSEYSHPGAAFEEPPYMKTLEASLGSFMVQLHALAQDCKAERISCKARAKWIWQKSKITALCQKAQRIQQQLDSAVGRLAFRSSLQEMRSQRRLLVEVHAVATLNTPAQKQIMDFSNSSSWQLDRLSQTTFGNKYPSRSSPCTCSCHAISRQLSNALQSFPSVSRCVCGCGTSRSSYKLDYSLSQAWARAISTFAARLAGFHITVVLSVPVYLEKTGAWTVLHSMPEDCTYKWMIRYSINPTSIALDGESVLEYAARWEQWGVVLYWLQNFRHGIPDTMLRRAAFYALHNLYTSRDLTDREVHACQYIISLSEPEDLKPLHQAVRTGCDLAHAFACDPCAINELDGAGETPLHIACRLRNLEAVRCLIEYGANINCRDFIGRTPLHIATILGLKPFAQALLAVGADVDASDEQGNTPLLLAAGTLLVADNSSTATFLIQQGASVHERDTEGSNILHLLIYQSNPGVIIEQALLSLDSAGQNKLLEAKDRFGLTPLMDSIRQGNYYLMEALLKAGAQMDVVDNNGENILHYAAVSHSCRILQCLKDARITGIDIRTPCYQGWTPARDFDRFIRGNFEEHPLCSVPTAAEIVDFENLLRDIRDRGIKEERVVLTEIMSSIREGRYIEARKALSEIMEAKVKARIKVEAETFRAIELDVRKGEYDLAIESLGIYMEVSNARLDVSPLYDPFDNDSDAWSDSDPGDESGSEDECSVINGASDDACKAEVVEDVETNDDDGKLNDCRSMEGSTNRED